MSPVSPAQTPVPAAPTAPTDLDARLARLPRYYTYKDVLALVFDGDEDAFTRAYCDGSLSAPVRDLITETAGDQRLLVLLLRLLVRQQAQLLAAWGGSE